MFTHLHTHTAFSFLEGTFSIPQFLFRMEEIGFRKIALTDTNRFSGAIHFYKFARQIGIKPILGCCLKRQKPKPCFLQKM